MPETYGTKLEINGKWQVIQQQFILFYGDGLYESRKEVIKWD